MGGSSAIKTFRDLRAWQSAKRLAIEVFHECRTVPKSEVFTVVLQMRRSSESVPNNVAEGFGLGSRPGFLRHLRIARGSLCELDTQREIAIELGLLRPREGVSDLLSETHRLIQALIKSIERSRKPGPEQRHLN